MTKVIVIDDDTDTLQMLSNDITEHLGYEVLAFSDPIKALQEIMVQTDIDAIISDEKMPGLTGLQLLKAAVDCGYTGHMFIFSGYADDSMSFELLKIEMINEKSKSKFGAISKPSTKKLLGILKDAIDDRDKFEEIEL